MQQTIASRWSTFPKGAITYLNQYIYIAHIIAPAQDGT